MSRSADRLERALELFVAYRANGGDWQHLLDANPDLADMLAAMRDDDDDDGGAAAADGSATTIDASGDVLGDYRLGRVVGEGGIGTVHEARDRLLDRRVAVKVLRPESAASTTALARFRREAQTLARLDHPNVVRVLGVGEDGGRHWLAMAFVEGESLAARLERIRAAGGHSGDSLRSLVQAIATVATALQNVHEAGIVHRDVKPSNILLRADGSPVLTDFGIARDRDDPTLTSPGAVIGSPRYMAPEQVVGGGSACDERSDVFSLGATLYECVTLQPAFAGASIEAALTAIVHSDPRDPRRLQRGVPVDLAAIVMKALEKDPARRYATAQAMADDLRAFLDLREITARAPSRVRRWMRRMRQQPLFAAFVVSAAIATLSLLWVGLQWPRLHAAAVVRDRQRYDDAVVRGFLARDERDAGRAWFESAIDVDPARSEAVLGLVFATSRRRGVEAALAELDERTARVDDENVARCRAWLLDRLQRRPEAEAIRRTIGPPSTSMGFWLEAMLGLEARDAAGIAKARELLSLAVRIAPQPNLILHTQWAGVVCNGGSSAERREAAEALVRLWPEHPRALAIAGVALLVVDPGRAESTLLRARELGADDPEVQVNLGIARSRLGKVDGAAAAFGEAFVRTAGRDALRATALLLLGQVDVAAADERAEQWLRDDPASPHAARFAGRAAFRRGEFPLAIERLQRAVAALGADLDVRLDLAFAQLEGGNAAEAAEGLHELVRSHPDHERAHMQLLDALDATSDRAGTVAESQRWAELRPNDPAAWRDFAAALANQPTPEPGDRDLVAAERADVLADGGDAVARELHAAALERRGETAAAARVRARRAASAK